MVVIDADLQDPPELIEKMIKIPSDKIPNITTIFERLTDNPVWPKLHVLLDSRFETPRAYQNEPVPTIGYF